MLNLFLSNPLNELPINTIAVDNRLGITKQYHNRQWTSTNNNMINRQQCRMAIHFHLTTSDNIIPENMPIHR